MHVGLHIDPHICFRATSSKYRKNNEMDFHEIQADQRKVATAKQYMTLMVHPRSRSNLIFITFSPKREQKQKNISAAATMARLPW